MLITVIKTSPGNICLENNTIRIRRYSYRGYKYQEQTNFKDNCIEDEVNTNVELICAKSSNTIDWTGDSLRVFLEYTFFYTRTNL